MLFTQAFGYWKKDRASILAPALAYHLVFALAPILLVLLSIFSYFYSTTNLRNLISESLKNNFDDSVAEFLFNILDNLGDTEAQGLANFFGLLFVIFTATSLINFLNKALNQIWYIEARDINIFEWIWQQLRNLVLIFLFGSVWIFSLIISRILPVLEELYEINDWIWLINEFMGVLVGAFIFFLLIIVLVETDTPFIKTFIGAFFTSVIIYFGRLVIDFYINLADPTSIFGAAGTLVLIFIWLYYSSHLYFFGMEFTKAMTISKKKG